jgi:GrpB protein
VDILLIVTDPSDEAAYVPPPRHAGYELRTRQPEFFEHRMLHTADRDVHLHVFGPDAAEADRMLAFHDTLRTNSSARQRYERVKRRLARREWPTMQQYADAKSNTIDDVLRNSATVTPSRALMHRRAMTAVAWPPTVVERSPTLRWSVLTFANAVGIRSGAAGWAPTAPPSWCRGSPPVTTVRHSGAITTQHGCATFVGLDRHTPDRRQGGMTHPGEDASSMTKRISQPPCTSVSSPQESVRHATTW